MTNDTSCQCDACVYPERYVALTGVEKTRLEAVRPDPALDGPAYEMGADLDDDGTVRFRPATVREQIDRLTAEDVWSRLVVWIDAQEPGDVT